MKNFLFLLFVLLFAAGFVTSAEKKKKEKAAKKSTAVVNIYEVKPDELDELVESNDEIFVLFYDAGDLKTKPILAKMDKLDFGEYEIPVVKISDPETALEYGLELEELPTAVMFQRGIPEEFPEDLNPEGFTTLTQWIKEELSGDDTPVLDLHQVLALAQAGTCSGADSIEILFSFF